MEGNLESIQVSKEKEEKIPTARQMVQQIINVELPCQNVTQEVEHMMC